MTERREKSLIGWVLVIHLPLMITQSVTYSNKKIEIHRQVARST